MQFDTRLRFTLRVLTLVCWYAAYRYWLAGQLGLSLTLALIGMLTLASSLLNEDMPLDFPRNFRDWWSPRSPLTPQPQEIDPRRRQAQGAQQVPQHDPALAPETWESIVFLMPYIAAGIVVSTFIGGDSVLVHALVFLSLPSLGYILYEMGNK